MKSAFLGKDRLRPWIRADTKIRPYKNSLTLPLSQREGIDYFCYFIPRAYAQGSTHAAPMALEKSITFSESFGMNSQ